MTAVNLPASADSSSALLPVLLIVGEINPLRWKLLRKISDREIY